MGEIERTDKIETLIYSTISDFETNKFPKIIQNYKSYIGITSERAKIIEDWQANIHYPFVSAIIDTIFSNVFDFSYSFNLGSEGLTNLMKKTFDFRDNGEKTIKDISKEALITGKGYVETNLFKRVDTYTVLGKEVEVVTKKPTMEYISAFDVFYDRNYRVSESPFVIKRKFMSGEKIKRYYGELMSNKIFKKTKEVPKKKLLEAAKTKITGKLQEATNNPRKFSLYDYNPIKNLTSTEAANLKSTLQLTVASVADKMEENNYFLRKDQKTFEVVEYSEGDDLRVYINGNLLYKGKEFIAGDIMKIEEVSFNDIPGTADSRGQADRLSDIQTILNSVWNGFLDNIKLGLNPMFEVPLAGDIVGPDGRIKFEKFKAFKTSTPGSIRKVDLGLNDFTPLAITEKIELFGQKVSGVSTYMMGGDARVERVSGGVALKEAQYKSKLSPLVKSINRMMASVSKTWVLMYMKAYSKEELIKLGLEIEEKEIETEEGRVTHITIDGLTLEEILNEENITFNIESLKSIDREASREKVTELLTILLQYGSPEQASIINIKEIFKAALLGDFNPDDILNQEAEQEPVEGGAELQEQNTQEQTDTQQEEGLTQADIDELSQLAV